MSWGSSGDFLRRSAYLVWQRASRYAIELDPQSRWFNMSALLTLRRPAPFRSGEAEAPYNAIHLSLAPTPYIHILSTLLFWFVCAAGCLLCLRHPCLMEATGCLAVQGNE